MALRVWCRNGHNPRSELKLVSERSDCAVFQCAVCKSVQVLTHPSENDRALYEKQRQAHEREVERRQIMDSRPVYFT